MEEVRAKKFAADGERLAMQSYCPPTSDGMPQQLRRMLCLRGFRVLRVLQGHLRLLDTIFPQRYTHGGVCVEMETPWFDGLLLRNDLVSPGMQTKHMLGHHGAKLKGVRRGYTF